MSPPPHPAPPNSTMPRAVVRMSLICPVTLVARAELTSVHLQAWGEGGRGKRAEVVSMAAAAGQAGGAGGQHGGEPLACCSGRRAGTTAPPPPPPTHPPTGDRQALLPPPTPLRGQTGTKATDHAHASTPTGCAATRTVTPPLRAPRRGLAPGIDGPPPGINGPPPQGSMPPPQGLPGVGPALPQPGPRRA